MKRRSRILSVESLAQRRLLAVMTVGGNDDARPLAVQLVEAVSIANADPDPDQIILSPGDYDFGEIERDSPLVVETTIELKGASPSTTKLIAAEGVPLLVVGESGELHASNMTLLVSYGPQSGGVTNFGVTSLSSVGFVGQLHDSVAGESASHSHLTNFGDLRLTNSGLFDSLGPGVNNFGSLEVIDSVIAGNSLHAVFGNGGQQLRVSGSLLIGNGGGLLNFDSATTVEDSVIFANSSKTIAGGIGVSGASINAGLSIDGDSVVIGNSAFWSGGDIASYDGGIMTPSQEATQGSEDAGQAALDSLAVTAVDLEAGNLQAITPPVGEGSATLTSSQVYWDATAEQWRVNVGSIPPADSIVADEIPVLDLGSVSGGTDEAPTTSFELSELFGSTLSRAQLNAWRSLQFESVSSEKGGTVRYWESTTGRTRWFSYQPPADHVGEDRIVVIARDADGDLTEGVISVLIEDGVAPKLELEAIERAAFIDLRIIAPQGLDLDSFELAVGFDHAVVRPVSTNFGDGYTNLQRSESVGDAIQVVGAFRDLEDASGDLATVRFERLSEGSPAFTILENVSWRLVAGSVTYGVGSVDVEQRVGIAADVNGDSEVTPRDALMVINYLSNGNGIDWRFDLNGDGVITPRDALGVINSISRGNQSEAESQVDYYFGSLASLDDDEEWLLPEASPTLF